MFNLNYNEPTNPYLASDQQNIDEEPQEEGEPQEYEPDMEIDVD